MSRENSTLRKEIKYILPLHKALIMKNSLDSLLQKDYHCINGIYSVRSLYFDSINNKDFSEKLSGTYSRKKVRIRIYNGDPSLCKLELKQKIGDCQHKQSFPISKDDVEEVMLGNFSILKNYFFDSDASIKIYSMMEMGKYKPAVLVEYDRTAYRHPMYDTRITLDANIRSTEANLNIFSPKIVYSPIECENVILEIKYSGKLVGYISDVLAQFGLIQNAYSKYCMGRRIYYDFNY